MRNEQAKFNGNSVTWAVAKTTSQQHATMNLGSTLSRKPMCARPQSRSLDGESFTHNADLSRKRQAHRRCDKPSGGSQRNMFREVIKFSDDTPAQDVNFKEREKMCASPCAVLALDCEVASGILQGSSLW